MAVTTATESPARPGSIQAAVLPLAVAATAAVVLATFPRAADTGEWARFIALALVGVSAHAFIARADRARAGHGAAVLVLPAGAVLLPLDLLVSLALVVSVPRWVAWPRAPRLTRLSELATEVAAATLAWLAAAGRRGAGVGVPRRGSRLGARGHGGLRSVRGDGPAFSSSSVEDSRAACRALRRSASVPSSCSRHWEPRWRPCA